MPSSAVVHVDQTLEVKNSSIEQANYSETFYKILF